MFDRAIVIIGAPAHTLESGLSATLRVIESFPVEKVVLYASDFARGEAEKIRSIVSRLTGVKPEVA